MYTIIGNWWKQLYKSPSRQPFSYQHLWCSQEAITESMKTGNIEAFPPQDCVRTIGTDLEGLKPRICCFRWALGVFHPEGLPLIPPLQPCEISETCFLWMLLITHTEVIVLPLADMGTSVKLLHECRFWLRESQGVTKWQFVAMSQYLHTTCSGLTTVPPNSCPLGTSKCDVRHFAKLISWESQDAFLLDIGLSLNPVTGIRIRKDRTQRHTGN